MQLSIIIVSYNVKFFLEQCLRSVQQAIHQIEAEILVIDNASTDGSVDYLAPGFPHITFIGNAENTGFARANNQGLRLASGKFILFLNPDTIIPEGCLQRCITFMESHPEAGACGIRMLDGTGSYLAESKRGFPSLQASFYKMSGLAALFPRSRRLAAYYLGHLSEKQDQEVEVLAGAYYFATREVLDITRGFDEQFFMYGEDIDLSYRIGLSGKKLHYLANPPIIHFKGESTKADSLQYIKMFYKAMEQFVRKHHVNYRSGWSRRLIEGSIWLRAYVAAAGKLLPKRAREMPVLPIETLVLGSVEELGRVTVILNRDHYPPRRISHLDDPAGLTKALQLRVPHEIIFCGGSLTYSDIIHHIEDLPKGISFFIHGGGTRSIVGSDSKQSSGHALA